MNKTLLLATITAILVFGVTSAYGISITLAGDAVVTEDLDVSGSITGPTVDAINAAINDGSICPIQNVQHWDKIIYQPTLLGGDIVFLEPQGQPALLENRQYDVKVIDDPNKNVDLSQAVADKLNQLGYQKQTVSPPNFRDINPNNILIQDVEYAIVCVDIPT